MARCREMITATMTSQSATSLLFRFAYKHPLLRKLVLDCILQDFNSVKQTANFAQYILDAWKPAPQSSNTSTQPASPPATSSAINSNTKTGVTISRIGRKGYASIMNDIVRHLHVKDFEIVSGYTPSSILQTGRTVNEAIIEEEDEEVDEVGDLADTGFGAAVDDVEESVDLEIDGGRIIDKSQTASVLPVDTSASPSVAATLNETQLRLAPPIVESDEGQAEMIIMSIDSLSIQNNESTPGALTPGRKIEGDNTDDEEAQYEETSSHLQGSPAKT